ncbi:MAG TPA: signal peptidase I [Candidatus Sulfotelmatobacter sp.]|jgi:signal peptidase I|nr:signal peptidase I [Candidatus Sulfotelmatobacter sp.]
MEFARKAYFFTLDLLQTVLLAASIFLVIYIFLFRPFQVSGDSMYPTFKNGEYILTNLIAVRVNGIQHGDVIVFKAPPDPEKDFIKRVIGLPGDTVELKEGFVYLNGNKLDESAYLHNDVRTYGGAFLKDGQSFIVPDRNYFVMGDNRPFSSDSREWGLLPNNMVIGKSFFVYWPITNMRLVHNPLPTSLQK